MLDALVLSAGIVRFANLEATDEQLWESVGRTQIEAQLWTAQAALPVMKAQRYGRVVVTVSGHGLYPTAQQDLAAYSVAKAAAFGLMNVLADEGAAFSIRANAISPVAATRMYRQAVGPGELLPEQVAPGVAFLASRECDATGFVLRASGGRFSLARYEWSDGVGLGTRATPEAVAAAWASMSQPFAVR